MNFPQQDPFWLDVATFLQSRVQAEEQILSPIEFRERLPNVFPYSSSYEQPLSTFQWIVVHKGMLSDIRYSFLNSVARQYIPVFANAVFVLFSLDSALPPVKSPDLDSLWNLLQTRDENLFQAIWGDHQPASSPLAINSGFKPFYNAKEFASVSQEELQQACRAHTQATYIGNETVLCRILTKYPCFVTAQDVGITPHLILQGYWESWITQTMARVLQPGDYCLDIGANHGYYSLLMADIVGTSGKVIAVEPNPNLADLISRTLAVNGFQSLGGQYGWSSVVQKAASDGDDQTVLLTIPHAQGINGTIIARPDLTNAEKFSVATITIDSLTRGLPRVNLIKIDVEGAEELVWRGMQQTIAQHHDIAIILEFNSGRHLSPQSFLEEIISSGFVLQHIDFDAQIKPLTIEQCLTERIKEDWMLFLQRPHHSENN